METKDIVNQLKKLVQLDVDAINAYEQAIKNIDHPSVKNKLQEFKGDHERHVVDVSNCISRLGGEAPKAKRDLKGFFLEGFTAIRSQSGTEGALKAMRSNEKLTNKQYSDALELALPDDIREVLQNNYNDEQRHLSYIERALRDRVWEEQRPHA